MLALVSRLYDYELGIVYVLTDEKGKLHTISSEDYLYRIRDKIVNYKISKATKPYNISDTKGYDAIIFKAMSKLVFNTTDYFDIRDITYKLLYARVGTLLGTGHSKRYVIDYELKKWLAEDIDAYRYSVYFVNEAINYLKSYNKIH